MIIKIKINHKSYIVNLPQSNVSQYYLNEYSEEIVECYK